MPPHCSDRINRGWVMKGWQIFVHSVRQVFGNLDGAVRVSGVLYLAQIAVAMVFGGGMMMSSGQMMQGGPGAGFFLGVLIVSLVTVVTGLWIAVSWHRYVLLGEKPAALPAYRGDRIWAYLLRSLGYGLILVVVGAVLGTVVGTIFGSLVVDAPMALGLILLGFLVYLPVLVVGFRLTSDLPATALGVDRPFLSGWAATKGQTADLIALAAIVVVAGVGLELIGFYLFSQVPGVSVIWALGTGWVRMMVGISIVTTLYGHYIENRPLI